MVSADGVVPVAEEEEKKKPWETREGRHERPVQISSWRLSVDSAMAAAAELGVIWKDWEMEYSESMKTL